MNLPANSKHVKQQKDFLHRWLTMTSAERKRRTLRSIHPHGRTISQSINHPVPTDDDADNHRAEWWATECEALGLHTAIMHWAMYLRNGKPFSVVVDHQALLYLVKWQGRLTNRKILNMLMNL